MTGFRIEWLVGCMAIACCAWGSQEVVNFWGQYDARKEPLKVEVVKKWANDKGNFELVRYRLGKLVGSNKTASPVIAAYYGYPKAAEQVPGIVQIHGGGQRASLSRVESWVALGYACVSINWGAKVLEEADTANTDWDGLAAGFIRPGVTKTDELDHHNMIRPDRNTLYKEPHLLNSSWNLIAMSARRGLTFLEQRSEVDGDKLGVEGHSMGGRSTVLTAIDPRVKAASPSVGGSGYLYSDLWGLPGSARRMTQDDGLPLYTKVVSAQSYWSHVKAPTLFLGATNDFNSPTEFVVKGMANMPASTEQRLALAPHLNHRFTTDTDAARFMWMDTHLKGTFKFPKQSKAVLNLRTKNGIPEFQVTVDTSAGHPIDRVEIYYGYARDPRIRFWRSAVISREGNRYSGPCPVFDVNEPLFAFANITYRTGLTLPARPGHGANDLLTLTSDYRIAYPQDLSGAGVKATEKPQRRIEDFSRGWQDWYQLNAKNPHHWYYATRKLLDPSWVGPKDGELTFGITTSGSDNRLAIGLEVNTWQGYTGRKKDTYHALVDLPKAGSTAVRLKASNFTNRAGVALEDWDEVTELFFTPAKRVSTASANQAEWQGKPAIFSKLRWEGGRYVNRPHPHESRGAGTATGRVSFNDEFQSAIKDSVKLEEQDEQDK